MNKAQKLPKSYAYNGARVLIACTVIVLLLSFGGSLEAQTNTKHITITEIEARRAIQYKIDAQSFYKQLQLKDSVVIAQKETIKIQRKKLFIARVETWAWRSLAVYTAYYLVKRR